MVQTRITIDDRDLSGALGRLLDATTNTRPLMASLGELGLNFVQRYFDEERSPSGDPWADLAPATLARKQKKRKLLDKLRERGRLFKSIVYRATDSNVVIGTNVVYARIHHFGGTIERPASRRSLNFRVNQQGRSRFSRASGANFQQDVNVGPYTITIPARPFLNLGDDPDFIRASEQEVEAYLSDAWEG